jgi:hypothetical protein
MTPKILRTLLLSLLLLPLLLGACNRTTTEQSALPSNLTVTIEGLPADVPADVTITNLFDAYEVTVSTLLVDLAAGRYQLEAAATIDDATGILYLPAPSKTLLDIPTTEAVTVTYSEACSNEDFDARERCVSLANYPQGMFMRNGGPFEVRASLQVLRSDGSSYQALNIGSATTAARYFTLELPATLTTLQMDSIGNVMQALSFEAEGCVRNVSISNPNARGNDLFLDIYAVSALADDALEGVDEEEFGLGADRIGELFLFNEQREELVLWIYSNAATSVFGRETCADLGSLDFDLDLEVGWNLVSLVFNEEGSGTVGVDVRRRGGFVAGEGRSFMVMPANSDELDDPNDPIISVYPDDFAELKRRPFGFINLPRNEFGAVQAPFNDDAKVALAVAANPGADSASLPFAPIAVASFEKAQQTLWSLESSALTTRMNEQLADGEGYARLRSFNLNPLDPDGQPFCSKPLTVAAGPSNPLYNTLNFEILTGPSNSFSGYTNLMYDSTVATWWYAPVGFRIEDSHNCEGQLELTKMRYEYNVDIQAGWNVVYTTIVPQDQDEFAADDGITYLDAIITTAAPTEVPFLYWRTTPDLTRDALPVTATVPDGGSQAGVIRGGVAPCDPGIPTCALTDLIDAGAQVTARSTVGDLPLRSGTSVVAGVTINTSGSFTFGLPGSVDPAVQLVSGSDTFIDNEPASFAATLILPNADVFQAVNGGVCGERIAPPSTSDAFLIRTTLDFVAANGNRMGTANLRGTSDSGRTQHVVEWLYASEAMQVAWTSGNGACEFKPLDGSSAVDNRAVTLNINLNLAPGWNMIQRTSTNPISANEPLTFTWSVIGQVPSIVSWHADVSIVTTGGVAADLGIGRAAFAAMVERASLAPQGVASQSNGAERTGRTLFRTLIDALR